MTKKTDAREDEHITEVRSTYTEKCAGNKINTCLNIGRKNDQVEATRADTDEAVSLNISRPPLSPPRTQRQL